MFPLLFPLFAVPSLFRRPNSPYWFAAYTGAHGARLKKSTKKTNRTEALTVLTTLIEAERQAAAGTLTESRARQLISEIVERTSGEAIQFHTCREWLNEWCASKKGATGDRTWLKYDQVCRDFLDHLESRADLSIAAITPKDVRGFRDALRKSGLSVTTVNQTARKVLAAPFFAAQRLGYIQTNPCVAVQSLKDDEDVERDVFTADQVGRLLVAADGDWKGAILAGYFTGLRLKDITELRWESVDLDANLLRTKTKKTGADVTIPLHPDLSAWLSERTRGIGRAPVFPELVGQSGTGRSGLSMQFRQIMQAARVKGRILRKRVKGGHGRTQMSLTFHSLRHSFVSAMANAGVAPELRQKLAGHSDLKSHAIYTHHELESLREAVAKVPGLKK